MKAWTQEQTKDFARLIDVWNTTRAAWIDRMGSDSGFVEWFNQQITV